MNWLTLLAQKRVALEATSGQELGKLWALAQRSVGARKRESRRVLGRLPQQAQYRVVRHGGIGDGIGS